MADISFFSGNWPSGNLAVAAFIAGVWTVTMLSPGLNLLATLHVTARGGARAGIATAAGIGLGTTIWSGASLFGLAYGRARRTIERATGALFVAAGLRLAIDRA